MLTKSKRALIAASLFSLVVGTAMGQSAYLDNGVNGTGLTVDMAWNTSRLEGIGLSAGYSISGILDLGLALNVVYDEIELFIAEGETKTSDSREINGSILYNVYVIKQQDEVPLSLQIIGSYGLSRTSSELLEKQNVTRRGSGFTVGTILTRDFTIDPGWAVRLGLLVDYRSYQYTIEPDSAPAEDSIYLGSQFAEQLEYGALVGLLIKPVLGPAVSVSFKACASSKFGEKKEMPTVRLVPFVNLTQPIRR